MESGYIVRFLVAFGAFLVIDLLWLGVVAKNFYVSQLGNLMAKNAVWPAAILFYVLFIVGLLYFAIGPALDSGSLNEALKNGALFGFFTNMTYELTNYAVIQDWPLKLVAVDILWGIILSTSVSYITFVLLK